MFVGVGNLFYDSGVCVWLLHSELGRDRAMVGCVLLCVRRPACACGMILFFFSILRTTSSNIWSKLRGCVDEALTKRFL